MDVELSFRGVPVTAPESWCTSRRELTAAAGAYCDAILDGLEQVRAHAADRLLALYNDTWLSDEIGTIDRAGFMARLSNPAIVLGEEPGCASLYFDDGDMFGGHYVVIGWEHGAPTSVTLAG